MSLKTPVGCCSCGCCGAASLVPRHQTSMTTCAAAIGTAGTGAPVAVAVGAAWLLKLLTTPAVGRLIAVGTGTSLLTTGSMAFALLESQVPILHASANGLMWCQAM